jgi:hypothetical protein
MRIFGMKLEYLLVHDMIKGNSGTKTRKPIQKQAIGTDQLLVSRNYD